MTESKTIHKCRIIEFNGLKKSETPISLAQPADQIRPGRKKVVCWQLWFVLALALSTNRINIVFMSLSLLSMLSFFIIYVTCMLSRHLRIILFLFIIVKNEYEECDCSKITPIHCKLINSLQSMF